MHLRRQKGQIFSKAKEIIAYNLCNLDKLEKVEHKESKAVLAI